MSVTLVEEIGPCKNSPKLLSMATGVFCLFCFFINYNHLEVSFVGILSGLCLDLPLEECWKAAGSFF